MDGTEGAAIEAAAAGFSVFPVKAEAKDPKWTGWQKSATTDISTIEHVWGECSPCNVGILCTDGLIVLDTDSSAGDKRLRAMLPATTTVETARGHHYYLRGNLPTCTIREWDLDVKGSGGYVVGAGSTHPSGVRYTWDIPPWDTPPQPIPDALDALLRSKSRTSPRGDIGGDVIYGPTVGQRGERDTALFSMARRAHGVTGASPEALLRFLEVENARRCKPPLPLKDLKRIAESAANYEVAPWKTDAGAFVLDARLSAKEVAVLRVLVDHANALGEAFPGYETLVACSRLGKSQIAEAIRGLELKGRIHVERGNRAGNRTRRPNHYRLLPYERTR